MWINHIGEIAMVFFVLLIAIHFALHFVFKAQRIKKDRIAQNKQEQD
ncbi:MAG: hypothetical protein U9N57_09415 [Pseudomonadota bacterium]|nr:hypothetical protein [Pseudomonadota bacterium]